MMTLFVCIGVLCYIALGFTFLMIVRDFFHIVFTSKRKAITARIGVVVFWVFILLVITCKWVYDMIVEKDPAL